MLPSIFSFLFIFSLSAKVLSRSPFGHPTFFFFYPFYAWPSFPPFLAPSISPNFALSLLTFSLSCPPSVIVIRGVRGDQSEESRTSTTDLSPPSLPLSLALLSVPSSFLLVVFSSFSVPCFCLRRWWLSRILLCLTCGRSCSASKLLHLFYFYFLCCQKGLKAQYKCATQFKWSLIDQNIPQSPPTSLSQAFVILDQTQTRPAYDCLQGSKRSLTPIIVDMNAHRRWSHELVHFLTSSQFLLIQPCLLNRHHTPVDALLSPLSPSPPRLSTITLSSTNHIEMPTMTFRFDPKETPKPCTHMRRLLPHAQGGAH